MTSAFNEQIGGTHYKQFKIQPIEYVLANGLGFVEGSVIKYISRWRNKGGVADLEKAKHFIEMLIEHEKQQAQTPLASTEEISRSSVRPTPPRSYRTENS